MKPVRIQRKRTKGFRLPDNTVCVTRGTRWGNPYTGKDYLESLQGQHLIAPVPNSELTNTKFNRFLVDAYEHYILSKPELLELAKKELKGKNLACFCSLELPCHADVLLELANKKNPAE